MAKYYDNSIDKTVDWGGDENTGGLPVSGRAVQEFIKDSLNNKIGVLYMDNTSNKYLAFADEDSKNEYLETLDTSLILGSFDAPANYTATIYLLSSAENVVLVGSTGNTIDFNFETTNKSGAVMGEAVDMTMTVTRGAYKQVIKRRYAAFTTVSIPVDEYIASGTTNFNISIVGTQTLAATAVTVRYKAVELSLSSTYDVSKTYNLATDSKVNIEYALSGYGTKVLEWYINGVQAPAIEIDTVKDDSAYGTRAFDISLFKLGRNEVEFRVASEQSEEIFYSKTIHKDVAVINNTYTDNIAMVSYTTNTLGAGLVMTQFEKNSLTVAGYSPSRTNALEVELNGSILASADTKNGVQSELTITPKESGTGELWVRNGAAYAAIPIVVSKSSLDITEIKTNLTFAFDADGKSNNSSDRDTWTSDGSRATLSGFNFETNGWIDGGLVMTNGCEISFTNAALLSGKSLTLGRTIEFEFETTDVRDDETSIVNLTNNGVGLSITATEATLSNGNASVSTKYDSNSRQRVSFVINKSTVSTEKGLFYIYVNGILSGAGKYGNTDFTNNNDLSISIGDGAGIILYNVRVYDMALSESQIINNYVLYRDSVDEMIRVYNRNNIYEEGSSNFNMAAMESMCPVMIVTGNIPILEATTDKKTQIVVDVEYTNASSPHLNFTAKNAIMTPQGTSSMAYPKKNFRLYTNKSDKTVLTVNGDVVDGNLYSFKDGAQPVDCWCFKADFAESSGTHNTGVARLWNEAMANTIIDGEYKLRTEAQRKAKLANYQYDVRTCVDGFPILMFYRLTEDDEPIFIGKYNFNNDKSTESVYGFVDIPNFDNSKVECWEGTQNGDPLGLFTTVENFDTKWDNAFEARYPDGNTNVTALKRLATWINSTDGDVDKFSKEKSDYFDVYKLAAYYIYVNRFAAVDQLVKNTMLTTEDGLHWYFINYDNDTICGLANDGTNIIPWELRRGEGSGNVQFAGNDSVLWKNMDADEDFLKIVQKVDKALLENYLSLDNVLDMFNEKQAGVWAERIYNLDAKYKYINPYTTNSTDNLEKLQGSRTSHRTYWLARRFDMYDGEFMTGSFSSNTFIPKFKIGTPANAFVITITAGKSGMYAVGTNGNIDYYKRLEAGEEFDVSYDRELNVGDVIYIYNAHNIEELKIDSKYLSELSLENGNHKTLGNRLKRLYLYGDSDCQKVSGIEQFTNLEEVEFGESPVGYIDWSVFKNIGLIGHQAASDIIVKDNPNIYRIRAGENTNVSLINCEGSKMGYIAGSFKNGLLTIQNSDSILKQMDAASGIFAFRATNVDITCGYTITITTSTNADSIYWDCLNAAVTQSETQRFRGKIDITGLDDDIEKGYIQTAFQNGITDILEESGDCQLISDLDISTSAIVFSSTTIRTDRPIIVSSENLIGIKTRIPKVVTGSGVGQALYTKELEDGSWEVGLDKTKLSYLFNRSGATDKASISATDDNGNVLAYKGNIIVPYVQFKYSSSPEFKGWLIPSKKGTAFALLANYSKYTIPTGSEYSELETIDFGSPNVMLNDVSIGQVQGGASIYNYRADSSVSWGDGKLTLRHKGTDATGETITYDIDVSRVPESSSLVIDNFWQQTAIIGTASSIGSTSSKSVYMTGGGSDYYCHTFNKCQIAGYKWLVWYGVKIMQQCCCVLPISTAGNLYGAIFADCVLYIPDTTDYYTSDWNNTCIGTVAPRFNYCKIYTTPEKFALLANDSNIVFENCNVYINGYWSGGSVTGCNITNYDKHTQVSYFMISQCLSLPTGTVLGSDISTEITRQINAGNSSIELTIVSPNINNSYIKYSGGSKPLTINISRTANHQQLGGVPYFDSAEQVTLNFPTATSDIAIFTMGTATRCRVTGNFSKWYNQRVSSYNSAYGSVSGFTANHCIKFTDFTGSVEYRDYTINNKDGGFVYPVSSSDVTYFVKDSVTDNSGLYTISTEMPSDTDFWNLEYGGNVLDTTQTFWGQSVSDFVSSATLPSTISLTGNCLFINSGSIGEQTISFDASAYDVFYLYIPKSDGVLNIDGAKAKDIRIYAPNMEIRWKNSSSAEKMNLWGKAVNLRPCAGFFGNVPKLACQISETTNIETRITSSYPIESWKCWGKGAFYMMGECSGTANSGIIKAICYTFPSGSNYGSLEYKKVYGTTDWESAEYYMTTDFDDIEISV